MESGVRGAYILGVRHYGSPFSLYYVYAFPLDVPRET